MLLPGRAGVFLQQKSLSATGLLQEGRKERQRKVGRREGREAFRTAGWHEHGWELGEAFSRCRESWGEGEEKVRRQVMLGRSFQKEASAMPGEWSMRTNTTV